MKHFLSAVALSALLIGAAVVPPAAAAPASADPVIAGLSVEESTTAEIIEEGLSEEGLVLEELEVGADGIVLEAESEEAADPFALELSLDPSLPTGTLLVTDEIEGQVVTTEYNVDIQTSTEDRAVFTLVNPDTGEEYTYDSAQGAESVAFVIPIAFAAISLSTALYYLAIGAAIVIAGVLALEAAKAVAKIIEENNRRSSAAKRDHYPALLSGSKVYISPSGLTKAQAVTMGKGGGDVWSISRTAAKSVAAGVNVSCAPVGAEKHGAGYLWHFHPCKRTPSMHSFYGLPA